MLRTSHLTAVAAGLAVVLMAASVLSEPAVAHGPHDGHGSNDGQAVRDFAAGEPGAGDVESRTVGIVMREDGGAMVFSPSRIAVRRGEQVRFVLQNSGALDHEFLIDTVDNNAAHKEAMAVDPDMQHEEPNGRRLKPGQTAELVWRFTKSGTFEIACLIPGHYESGMKGSVVVK